MRRAPVHSGHPSPQPPPRQAGQPVRMTTGTTPFSTREPHILKTSATMCPAVRQRSAVCRRRALVPCDPWLSCFFAGNCGLFINLFEVYIYSGKRETWREGGEGEREKGRDSGREKGSGGGKRANTSRSDLLAPQNKHPSFPRVKGASDVLQLRDSRLISRAVRTALPTPAGA